MIMQKGVVAKDFRWTPIELHAEHDWIFAVSSSLAKEVRATRFPDFPFDRSEFMLLNAQDVLDKPISAVNSRRGFAVINGFDLANKTVSQCESFLWSLGHCIGTAVPQDPAGLMIKRVRSKEMIGDALQFHTDRADLLALLYVKTGLSGGDLKMVSVAQIHNQLMAESPLLYELLFRPLPNDRRGENASNEDPWMMIPIMSVTNDGQLIGRFNRRYIDSTQKYSGVPLLTEEERKLVDWIDRYLKDEKNVFSYSPKPGDLVLINDHHIWHARSSYTDGTSDEEKRLLLRLWLSHPHTVDLPDSYIPLYGEVGAGKVRGGVPPKRE